MVLVIEAETATLGEPIRDHLGQHLRRFYHDLISNNLPRGLAQLVQRLERVVQACTEAPDPVFLAQLMEAVPRLRAFAISRTHNVDRAEDLVQETILRAWNKKSSFEPGTNLQAWLFTILRNQHHSDYRKNHREVEDPNGDYAAREIALPDQIDRLEMQDLASALDKLQADHRDALLLVGAQGMSYEEAASALGTPVGTVKSRVNRARNRLAELLSLEGDDAGSGRL